MPYSDETDLRLAAGGARELAQLTAGEGKSAIDAATLTKAQERADALIDGYANKMHTVPFAAPTPPLVRHLAAELTVHILKSWRGLLSEEDAAAQEKRIELLRDFSAGKVNPVASDRPPVGDNTAGPGAFTRDPETHAISRENLRGFS